MGARLLAWSFCYGHSDTLQAADSLSSILTAAPPTIQARAPFGIFKFLGINCGKVKKNIHPDWLKCVCFSETPLHELNGFYQATQDPKNWSLKTNRYRKYGLAFEASYIRSKGGHPVLYFARTQTAIQGAVEALAEPNIVSTTRPILPYFEPFGPLVGNPAKSIDFRWEREWRINGSLEFAYSDVSFGICDEREIPLFQNKVSNKFPFIDPDWGIQELGDYLVKNNWTKLARML